MRSSRAIGLGPSVYLGIGEPLFGLHTIWLLAWGRVGYERQKVGAGKGKTERPQSF